VFAIKLHGMALPRPVQCFRGTRVDLTVVIVMGGRVEALRIVYLSSIIEVVDQHLQPRLCCLVMVEGMAGLSM